MFERSQYLRPIFQNVSHASDVFLIILEFIRAYGDGAARVSAALRGAVRRNEARSS